MERAVANWSVAEYGGCKGKCRVSPNSPQGKLVSHNIWSCPTAQPLTVILSPIRKPCPPLLRARMDSKNCLWGMDTGMCMFSFRRTQ